MAFSISLPASRQSSLPAEYPQQTNTITVTRVPKDFFHPVLLDVLRDHFAIYGEINRWAPLPGFGRIIIVYRLEHSAESAKQHCDRIAIQRSQDGYESRYPTSAVN